MFIDIGILGGKSTTNGCLFVVAGHRMICGFMELEWEHLADLCHGKLLSWASEVNGVIGLYNMANGIRVG